ncbi:MAG: C4-type zinc ribbon domain-containing protein [Bacteroidota bacterium]
MENRLRSLYLLQLVDSNLDELQEMKGDLPQIVAELSENVKNKLANKKELEDILRKSITVRDQTDIDILSLKAKIEKYKAQQFQVKTNKQYDILAREIDLSQEKITKLQRDMETLEGKAMLAKEDAEKLIPELETLQAELANRKKELAAVNKEHEDEELKLHHQREKIVSKISKSDYQMYSRIRKAEDGRAIVSVKRMSCGGCFNRVTPQRVLELRKNAAMIACERCGRILVSDEIVESAKKIL